MNRIFKRTTVASGYSNPAECLAFTKSEPMSDYLTVFMVDVMSDGNLEVARFLFVWSRSFAFDTDFSRL
jgi:hypothetical protein